jgi:Fic family protein
LIALLDGACVKKPLTPPTTVPRDITRIRDVILRVDGPLAGDRYLHWDDLRHREPPDGLSPEEWWFGLKIRRRSSAQQIPLVDSGGAPFSFGLVNPIPELLHRIDTGAGAWVGTTSPILSPDLRDQYYVRSLMEEAITSSQLEGAATTRQVAKEMILSGRPPRDKSEQMIRNNYDTMQRLRELKDEPLTPELVVELHARITRDTFDDPGAAGRFRRREEHIVVSTDDNVILHVPPPAEELPDRVRRMCAFANETDSPGFVHPVLRAIMLHFWLAYDHPFVDGNGRVARTLFYWLMMRHNYWLFEFISISEMILKGPVQYSKAFLYTETDENDLTYFVLYHLAVIEQAVEELHKHIERKAEEIREVSAAMKGIAGFNHRQQAILSHATRHPGYRYTIEGHKISHAVAYQTARTDLQRLAQVGLLSQYKIGRTWYFEPVPRLEEALRRLARSGERTVDSE